MSRLDSSPRTSVFETAFFHADRISRTSLCNVVLLPILSASIRRVHCDTIQYFRRTIDNKDITTLRHVHVCSDIDL